MSDSRESVPVSLPSELVERLDELVEADVFGSRSAALRYGARLVVREERIQDGDTPHAGDSPPTDPAVDDPPGRPDGGDERGRE